MSSLLEKRVPTGKIGLLASIAGLGTEECAAVRRHAERVEARGDWQSAAESYQVAAMVEPGEAAGWEGLSRCFLRLGDSQRARQAQAIADVMRRKFG